MKSTLIIPTYNEKENIRIVIPQIFSILPDISILVVDDNSPDGTAKEVLELQKIFPRLSLYNRPKKEGLGTAYLDAFKKILEEDQMDIIFTMDADLSHNPKYLPQMIRGAEKYDFVIGSRYIKGGGVVGWEKWRKILSDWGNRYCRLVTGLPTKDCTSGFQCIKTSLLKKIDFSDFDASGYAFLMYLKYKSWKQEAKITEVPIIFKNRETGESKISGNIIKEGLFLPWKLIAKPKKTSFFCPNCLQQTADNWFTKNNHQINKCRACGLIFVYPAPNNTETIYNNDYFCGAQGGFGYINYDNDKKADFQVFEKYLNLLEQYKINKGHLLDVGAATGIFLDIAKKRGWNVAGVEISEYASQKAKEKGLEVFIGTMENLKNRKENFDAITMWDLIEHVPDPKQQLAISYNLLKPGGLLAINTPDAGSFYAKIRGKKWHLILPPEHINLFNQANLKQLLEKSGFKILAIKKIGKKFKIPYIFQILYTVNRRFIWKFLSDLTRQIPILNKFNIPINLRDNMFIIAKKSTDAINNKIA